MNISNHSINVIMSTLRRLVPENEKLVIACSGGADSMALLFCAQKAGYPLVVAHVVHDMRNEEESLKDRDLVKSYCEKNGLEFVEGCAFLKKEGYANENVPATEDNYRRIRYAIINNLAYRIHFADKSLHRLIPTKILTAHHADDQLETMLMKMCRGSGLRGMSGISERKKERGAHAHTYIRPMLKITKQEIYEICKLNNIPFNEDNSNADTDYVRNKIRHEVLPLLKGMFPNCSVNASRTALSIEAAQELADEALYEIKKHETSHFIRDPDNGALLEDPEISIPVEALRLANSIVVYEWLRYAFKKAACVETNTPSLDLLNRTMIEQVTESIKQHKNRKFSWPHSVTVSVNQTVVRVSSILPKNRKNENSNC